MRSGELMRGLHLSLLLPLGGAVGCAHLEPAPSCQRFVSCIQARDALDGTSTDVERFEAGGACWTSEEGAEQCATACEEGLSYLRAHEVGLPEECLP